jgi:integron integrase
MKEKKILSRLKEEIRRRNYSYSTEKIYSQWIVRYVRFHKFAHPRSLDEDDVVQYLNHLANGLNVAASTQNQALSAIVFLYSHILGKPLQHLDKLKRAKKPKRLPVVLTEKESLDIIQSMSGVPQLVVSLLYGSGLRISEALRLRIQDLDLNYKQITVRNGKGLRDRITMIPESRIDQIAHHIQKVKNLHNLDLEKGYGETVLPKALARKYPGASKKLRWQYLFPSKKRSVDPRSGTLHRYHISQRNIRRAVRRATNDHHIQKHVTPHTFRHSFATHLLSRGYDIRTVQELLGHKSVKTTMVYTHVLNKGGHGVKSPLDE